MTFCVSSQVHSTTCPHNAYATHLCQASIHTHGSSHTKLSRTRHFAALGSSGCTFAAWITLPALLPKGNQAEDFAATQVDGQTELVVAAHFQEAHFFQWATDGKLPCTWERSKNFLENVSLCASIGPCCQKGGSPVAWCSTC